MRTVQRLGTAAAITILALGVAASCALPPYHTGENTSTSGSGGASSGGEGGAVTVGSSSKASSSSSSSGGDGGTCDSTHWGVCTVAPGTKCDCPGQACYLDKCSNLMTGGILPWQVCDKAT